MPELRSLVKIISVNCHQVWEQIVTTMMLNKYNIVAQSNYDIMAQFYVLMREIIEVLRWDFCEWKHKIIDFACSLTIILYTWQLLSKRKSNNSENLIIILIRIVSQMAKKGRAHYLNINHNVIVHKYLHKYNIIYYLPRLN